VFKNSTGWKKLDLTESDFFIEFQMSNTDFCLNSTEFCVNSANFWKIGHHRIRRISTNFSKFGWFFKFNTKSKVEIKNRRGQLTVKRQMVLNSTLPPTSVRKFGGTMKIGRHRSRRFLKNSVKIRKIQVKRTGDDGWTVKPVSPINQPVFQKTGMAIFGWFLSEPGRFLSKIGKWNEKTVKNNGITYTKFIHANSP
jgi:hypothetical protein